MKQASVSKVSPRWSRVTRALAFVPAVAASTFSFCGGLPPECPPSQPLSADDRDFYRNAVSPAVAAQCSAPGPVGAPCAGSVTCGSGIASCCGLYACVPARDDAGADAGYAWTRLYCAGPLDPPELGPA